MKHMRAATLWALLLIAPASGIQSGPGEAPGALSFNDAVGLPMSRGQILSSALDAWEYTFGQEPGAHLERVDKEIGVIEGTARLNYRSAMLLVREETMGSINYRVSITAENGQCILRVSNLVHVGNHGAQGGGIDIGTILSGDGPVARPPGVSPWHARGIHAEIRDRSTARIGELMQAFTARLRRAGQH